MSTVNLSIAGLFERVFGYKSSAFEPKFQKLPQKKETGEYGSPYWGIGENGLEYYMPVEINVGSDRAAQLGLTNADGSTTGRWQLPYPVVSVSNEARIIDTVLTERRGFVSEFINTAGWRISVKGFLIGTNNEFPERDFKIMSKVFTVGAVMQMRSALTDILLLDKSRLGSDEVVVRSVDMPGVPGVQNVRAYTLEFTANEPFNLIDIS